MLISWAAAPTRASNTLANTTAIHHNDDGDDGDGDYDDDGYNDDGGGTRRTRSPPHRLSAGPSDSHWCAASQSQFCDLGSKLKWQ